jgi:hypothetical protein
VTTYSSTTIIYFAARASRGLISDDVASAAPPAIAVLRPNPLTLIPPPCSTAGSVERFSQRETGRCPARFRCSR